LFRFYLEYKALDWNNLNIIHTSLLKLQSRASADKSSWESMVRARGLEPPILTEPDPKSGVSANSTTRATPPIFSPNTLNLKTEG
jgi:hypothetical protein